MSEDCSSSSRVDAVSDVSGDFGGNRSCVDVVPFDPEVRAVSVVEMYGNSKNPDSQSAFQDSRKLGKMCENFFNRLQIPVNMQLPFLSMATLKGEPLLVMKGLLFNDEIRAAFGKYPEISVFRLPGRFLEEVQMPVEFFESVVVGEEGRIQDMIAIRATDVVDA